jgi:hypothetical protein
VTLDSLPSSSRRLLGRFAAGLAVAAALLVVAPPSLSAQPFGAWMVSPRGSGRYVSIPHNSALNPTAQVTYEAWVNLSVNANECVSIAGKGYSSAWWLGACRSGSAPAVFRTYLRGSSSLRDAGIIPTSEWTHVAVTFDGTTRRHYINGELINSWTEATPLTTSANEVRIGSDANWSVNPNSSIDEFRIWNVARSVSQLRDTINVALKSPQSGLVGVWGLNGSALAAVGPYNGTNVGGVTYFTLPATLTCGSSGPTALCLSTRFAISASYRVGAPGTAETQARVVPFGNTGSGLFYFFDVNNWEIMVKSINACGLNNRYWIFSAATTSLFYRLEVIDVRGGTAKIYFNYPGSPAPAVTDTDAFASCPV